ncbi:2-dehydro-3-deoxy-phosphogluconate aldolase [Chelativorans sp. Marseille-P2723]|uniref:2-dehydro-3-deoxy-phosphogluconate aldolase n=1 Tax=Chelativorans sp. Marseille-P2723 TaxID=2709133 RepID=UPI001570C4D9|nr:2-dehydro-3-deoxy-phosphogluconate aldolase [Chelativorans sp. Marseille-P2723]
MNTKTERLLQILSGQPVIPVLRIERAADAVPLARALVRGGLPAIEITLRTPGALEAIRIVTNEVPEAAVGAGTILSSKDFESAEKAGAQFIVSPGANRNLLTAASQSALPFLPGGVTPSEIMALRDEGYEIIKFFPAEQAGGIAYLKSLASPLPGMRFCPTGGISSWNAADYLSLSNVVCVGGSWVAPEASLAAADWDKIEELARQAASLRTG